MAKNKQNQYQNKSNNMQPPVEPAENIKNKVESCKDMRSQQKNGGRSTTNKAEAPDGISGNWK